VEQLAWKTRTKPSAPIAFSTSAPVAENLATQGVAALFVLQKKNFSPYR
jgi:hypothetical protein